MTDPYTIKLSEDQRSRLGLWLARELDSALDARASQEADVDYWHQLYEQARTRSSANTPWPDAADLTSYIPTEKVDALHARIMRTVFGAEPVWTVEGWGDAVQKAPFVEEYHQWKMEEERFQSIADRWLLVALIESRAVLEICEGYELATTRRKTMKIAAQTDPATGGPIFDENAQILLKQDENGQYLEPVEDEPFAELVLDDTEPVRTGPQYRVLPYKDSVIFPEHARHKDEIWGYGKRFTKRLFELQAQAKGRYAIYDKATVDRLTNTTDVEPDAALERSKQGVATTQDNLTTQKELWEVLVHLDLDVFFENEGLPTPKGCKGLRWFVATLHKDQQLLLRLQHDDVDRGRYVPAILFPRPDRATDGFSFIGHKLITITEEHTAWRNMAADKGSLAVQAPIQRMSGALWDPYEQPWGPKAVIDVRNPQEITQATVTDVPASTFQHISMLEAQAERVAGINDVASGRVSQEDRTLGEVNMATEQSFVRMDLIVRRFQEALEDVAQITHAIHKRALAEKGDEGVAVPQSLIIGLEGRGVPIDTMMPDRKFTASLLDGSFRFKPHGSVQTADPNKQRQDFIAAMQFLPNLLQVFPLLVPMFQTPEAARAVGRTFLHLFHLGSQQAFLGSASQQMPPEMGMGMPGMGMPPMMPGGGPPMVPGMGTPPPMSGLPGPADLPPGLPMGPQ